ncbi:helix-turn-helix transcriptional regulator [Gallibacterium trehalosifermentans]|uniref:Helix-turn-helix transcriptional regulator n=1 Tax=Gallibacterium trehalosifermentans TaxID=516935 RepID=A0ABV6GYX0_9PAST
MAEEFGVSSRTIQRDINQRLAFLPWEEKGPRFYKLSQNKIDVLTEEDIQRFALFASISDLFPSVDKAFYQEKLTQSVQVKGIQYENISGLTEQFEQLKEAINQRRNISFKYKKVHSAHPKFYQVSPYSLTNKNGIWYLIATDQLDNHKQKTFCFSQISHLRVLTETYIPNQKFIDEIKQNDSLSYGNQLPEVVIRVSDFAANFFLRRNLLPNQTLLHKLESGELLLSCKEVNELDILPIVQYWIPHLTIVSPNELQKRMLEKLNDYLINQSGEGR